MISCFLVTFGTQIIFNNWLDFHVVKIFWKYNPNLLFWKSMSNLVLRFFLRSVYFVMITYLYPLLLYSIIILTVISVFKPKHYTQNENKTCSRVSGVISIIGGRLGRHLEYWSYARFAKVTNAWFENYRFKRVFWCIKANVILRRLLTPFSMPLMKSQLLHVYVSIDNHEAPQWVSAPLLPDNNA